MPSNVERSNDNHNHNNRNRYTENKNNDKGMMEAARLRWFTIGI